MIKSKNYNGNQIVCEYDSSNLKKGVYDTVTKKLTVTFGNDMRYEYDEVPHDVFAELNLAESQGKYFNQKIAKGYTYKRIID
jgi:hypothetical protein